MQHPTHAALVLAVRGTGQEPLRSALRTVVAAPDLIGALARIVVVDTARTSTLLHEAVRLPVGLLRVVQQPRAAAPAVLARLLVEAVAESDATHVLVLDDVALTDPAVLVAAIDRARRSASADVVGLRDPASTDVGPIGWWGAVLPLDAIRAIGTALPESGDVALAELVLRADAAGFRSTTLDASGPVPVVEEADRLLLALLHQPVAARRAVLLGALRPGDPDGLRALLGGPEVLRDGAPVRHLAPRLGLWVAWPALRRRYRTGALARSSAEAWTLRFLGAPVNHGWPSAEREEAAGRRPGLRLRTWPTTKRGTSAA